MDLLNGRLLDGERLLLDAVEDSEDDLLDVKDKEYGEEEVVDSEEDILEDVEKKKKRAKW